MKNLNEMKKGATWLHFVDVAICYGAVLAYVFLTTFKERFKRWKR